RRATLLEQALTTDERIALVHGDQAMPILGTKIPAGAIGSAGYIAGIPRLGLPALQETDASLGVSNLLDMRPGDVATALPSTLAIAASFDPALAYDAGAMIGREARLKGFNVLLGGGDNLIRDPRSGRNFEYYSEDPLLSGAMAGAAIRGTQDQHVLSTVKHYAFGDQETGRMQFSARIGEAAARASDLLAFEIAIERGHPGAVMCAYNRYAGPYACENEFLLQHVLKGDWGYPGWVMSDWGAVHAVAAANAGLDQESGAQRDAQIWFGAPLAAALRSGAVPPQRLSDMVHRILRSMFAVGLFDHPPKPGPIDYAADGAVALRAEQQGIVLLANRDGLLPLAKSVRSIAVIGGQADAGVLSGGGSSQVIPVGGVKRLVPVGGEPPFGPYLSMIFGGSAPYAAIKAKVPQASVHYVNGRYPKAAADAARQADVAIVFANQWMGEEGDAPDMSLPEGQDALIAAVTAANPHTIVVLQTGGAVRMPWLAPAGAVLEAWYPGQRGGDAIADVLFGDVDAGGRLPVTFPADESQLPRPVIAGTGLAAGQPFDLDLGEGAEVGYRGDAARGVKPLFPFGYGLSYTHFAYSGLHLQGGNALEVSFDVRNAGARAGVDVPQVYLTRGCAGASQRLLGWARVELAPGQTHHVKVSADPRLLADFDVARQRWRHPACRVEVAVGASSQDLRLRGGAALDAVSIAP
ncbi:MAG: glycoside hydrolase family 3 C-terminal domain-containing protein, partial [Burkholderiales bacterium]|nr:glycoside hydrolase family 3 C-terminal domain-containing protein [Burkholderiales bacterium]